MRPRVTLFLPALLIALGSSPSDAAESVRADTIVHITRARPSHRLVEVTRVQIPYGTAPDSLGFEPRGPEREAVGPAAFDVDEQGTIIVADPVRAKLFRVGLAHPQVSSIGALPLPFSDVAIGRDGKVLVADLKTRSVTVIGEGRRTELPGRGTVMRFIRQGRELVLETGSTRSLVRDGGLSSWAQAVTVEKCNAEAGLITTPGKRIQLEIGGPLASMRLIGVGVNGDMFLAIEQFKQRGRLEVDRRVVVLDAAGTLKASLEMTDRPSVQPSRDFAVGPRGDLYRMVPGTQGVTFVRWEVRP